MADKLTETRTRIVNSIIEDTHHAIGELTNIQESAQRSLDKPVAFNVGRHEAYLHMHVRSISKRLGQVYLLTALGAGVKS